MSRNNFIVVLRDRRFTKEWYYVFSNLNADNDWNYKYFKKLIRNSIQQRRKRTSNRGIALMLAHDIQKKIKTEYGVSEVTLFY